MSRKSITDWLNMTLTILNGPLNSNPFNQFDTQWKHSDPEKSFKKMISKSYPFLYCIFILFYHVYCPAASVTHAQHDKP